MCVLEGDERGDEREEGCVDVCVWRGWEGEYGCGCGCEGIGRKL